jgi:two-component system sensor histidine kinase CpxA
MELRRDELGDLVRDFNRMANKTEHLISSQRQLLYDVSHELRSPLARMNVALDLLRGRVREDPALNRMEIDLQRLNEMMGRLLTVAKLEATSTLQTPVRVNLSELVSSVASDANFEAQERGSHVDVVQAAGLAVLGIRISCGARLRMFFATRSDSLSLGQRSRCSCEPVQR